MNSTIQRAMELNYDFSIDSDKFIKMSDQDRELMINSLSEKEKFENLGMFKTLPNGKVGWNNDN